VRFAGRYSIVAGNELDDLHPAPLFVRTTPHVYVEFARSNTSVKGCTVLHINRCIIDDDL
jgi:hypothetical protein